MSCIAYVKTSSMEQPWPWVSPLRMLQRTTADNLWKALAGVAPMGFDGTLPSTDQARWIWIVTVCDQATANKRLQAHLETVLLAARPRVLTCSFPCVVHILHRGVVPLLRVNNMHVHLYRTSHVLSVSSYWAQLYTMVTGMVHELLVVVHNYAPNAQHAGVARQVLRLAWCDGLPDEMISGRRKKVMDETLRVFVGNWASETMLYLCPRQGCEGGAACRAHAVAHATQLLSRLLFSRKPVEPTVSRWWKCMPLTRVVLLGVAVHSLWARACPRRARGANHAPPAAAEGHLDPRDQQEDEHWRAIHNYRCERTWQYFQASDTAVTPLLVLSSLSPAHQIMAWVLARGGVPSRTKREFCGVQTAALTNAKPKPEVLLEFFGPATSPIWSALHAGSTVLLTPHAQPYWQAVVDYHRGSFQACVLLIWQSYLPSLVRIWWRMVTLARGWPQRLLLLLSDNEATRQRVAREFMCLKPCCVPRGVKALHESTRSLEDLLSYETKVLVQELAWQLDLSIFDREVSHARTKAHVEASNGHALGFESVVLAHFGKEVWQHFAADARPGAQTLTRGRPKSHVKRRRYDAWNAYVATNKPNAEDQRSAISSGAHLRRLGELWRNEPQHVKQEYVAMARAECARRECDSADAESETLSPRQLPQPTAEKRTAITGD